MEKITRDGDVRVRSEMLREGLSTLGRTEYSLSRKEISEELDIPLTHLYGIYADLRASKAFRRPRDLGGRQDRRSGDIQHGESRTCDNAGRRSP